MYQKLALAAVAALSFTAAATAQQSDPLTEADVWSVVKQSSDPGDVFTFIENYPDGEFAMEARALMIDLLWTEVAETPDQPEEAVAAEPAAVTTAAADPVAEEAPEIVPITFTGPLTQGDPHVVGNSLEKLITGFPTFPPVEGLPESYWKSQSCSNCHDWQQANLCDQAGTYLTEAGSQNLDKRHPYGGTFKSNLRAWAASGCE